MKAQMTFLSKPVMLIMTIAVLLILLQTVWSTPVQDSKQELTVQLMARASGLLDILLSSEDCLATRARETDSAYAYVVSKEKLDDFMVLYNSKEPTCARNFEYGYTLKVEEYCTDDSKECLTWEFGALKFSPISDLTGRQTRSLPVAILHGKKDIRVGKATLTIADGALERVAGFLDKSCLVGPTGATERSYRISFRNSMTLSGKEICLGQSCRPLDCEVNDARLTAGSHVIRSVYKDGVLEVSG